MRHTFMLAALLTLALGGTAMAACPSEVPGSSSEAIKANEQRVLCLLREVEDASRLQQYEAQLDALERRINMMPRISPPAPYVPPVFELP